MANVRQRFQFGAAYQGQHGSPTFKDSFVPLAFGFLGATGNTQEDTVSKPVLDYLLRFNGEYIQQFRRGAGGDSDPPLPELPQQ